MNLILESVLNEQLIREAQLDNNSLEFLNEYLASTRGITLTEAQELIILVEDQKRKGIAAINEIAIRAAKKLNNIYVEKKNKIISESSSTKEASKEAKRLKKIADARMKTIKKWLEKQKKSLSNMSKKKKIAIAGAAVGIPAIAGGLKSYALYRRKKREASK